MTYPGTIAHLPYANVSRLLHTATALRFPITHFQRLLLSDCCDSDRSLLKSKVKPFFSSARPPDYITTLYKRLSFPFIPPARSVTFFLYVEITSQRLCNKLNEKVTCIRHRV